MRQHGVDVSRLLATASQRWKWCESCEGSERKVPRTMCGQRTKRVRKRRSALWRLDAVGSGRELSDDVGSGRELSDDAAQVGSIPNPTWAKQESSLLVQLVLRRLLAWTDRKGDENRGWVRGARAREATPALVAARAPSRAPSETTGGRNPSETTESGFASEHHDGLHHARGTIKDTQP
eukprot:3124194-Rhodomonas_salina.1